MTDPSHPPTNTSLPPNASSAPSLKCLTNCQVCIGGELIPQDLYFSPETGLITPNYYYRSEIEKVDLKGAIIAPGYLDLQINGRDGVHFTSLGEPGKTKEDAESLAKVAEGEARSGVTGWWATVPTIDRNGYEQTLSALKPQSFPKGATLLGAHVEGPYLHPTKCGAHNPAHLLTPGDESPEALYSSTALSSTIKLITVAPEVPSITPHLITDLTRTYPSLRVSLGHSTAPYSIGHAALTAGATSLTHLFNAMPPLHHRNPGLAGLISSGKCFYSIIADGVHVHPSLLTLAQRTDPARCIVISDGTELTGLPDGVYPGNAQVGQTRKQRKEGNSVYFDETPETLVGSAITLDECVRVMVREAGVSLAEAVRCVTENVAAMMGEGKRGVLEPGRKADFVVLDWEGNVRETWVQGERVYRNEGK